MDFEPAASFCFFFSSSKDRCSKSLAKGMLILSQAQPVQIFKAMPLASSMQPRAQHQLPGSLQGAFVCLSFGFWLACLFFLNWQLTSINQETYKKFKCLAFLGKPKNVTSLGPGPLGLKMFVLWPLPWALRVLRKARHELLKERG